MALLEVDKWKYVGVDGCKGGWFCVGFDEGGDYGFAVIPTFGELLDRVPNAELVLIDIPIGLPEGPCGRQADFDARSLLDHKDRKSSVFPAPARQTVRQAKRNPKDRVASEEIERETSGNGLSPFAFGIAPKIAEVDVVMVSRKTSGNTKPCVREVHPELCFWALNSKKAMQFPKRKRRQDAENLGELERLQVLRKVEGQTDSIFRQVLNRFRRSVVAGDDILDALSAAATARLVCTEPSGMRTAPANPPMDNKGLPMEMVYWLPPNARQGGTSAG